MSDKIDFANVEKIIKLVRSLSNNNVASYSYNTHVIFDDYNLWTGQQMYDALTDKEHWLEYIQMHAKDLDGDDFVQMIADMHETMTILEKLCSMPDCDLEHASDCLLGINEDAD